ncbi:ATP-binding protein [Actinoplanes subtropicus]|uniref:ATP-binding protein n=1 Tax=Actinoplanes subtropicus TaxID=543632 RepID=UPI0004C44170|nr:ATP-binding protein [Actinoplanes subtropicus]
MITDTLADRVRRVRAATFVGLRREIELCRGSLHRPDPLTGFAVLHVWGPGGIGKSALLRRLVAEAELAGGTGTNPAARDGFRLIKRHDRKLAARF